MAADRKSERAKPERSSEPSRVVEDAAPDLIRVGVPLALDGEAVLWDRFKNDTGRNRTRKFIRNEAVKMGMVEATAEKALGVAADEVVTVRDVCDFVSLFLQAAAVQTIPDLAPDDLSRVTIQDHHVALMNKGGAGDRVLAKWIGKMPVKDEITFGAGVLMAGASIFGSFRALRAEKLAARADARPMRPVAVMTMPGPADASMGS